ncbi:hypothetical protein E4U55_005958 [Claviceps digitariae]|nr:hypothetical protein E4U55_005958 [Claviceps digitariae]
MSKYLGFTTVTALPSNNVMIRHLRKEVNAGRTHGDEAMALTILALVTWGREAAIKNRPVMTMYRQPGNEWMRSLGKRRVVYSDSKFRLEKMEVRKQRAKNQIEESIREIGPTGQTVRQVVRIFDLGVETGQTGPTGEEELIERGGQTNEEEPVGQTGQDEGQSDEEQTEQTGLPGEEELVERGRQTNEEESAGQTGQDEGQSDEEQTEQTGLPGEEGLVEQRRQTNEEESAGQTEQDEGQSVEEQTEQTGLPGEEGLVERRRQTNEEEPIGQTGQEEIQLDKPEGEARQPSPGAVGDSDEIEGVEYTNMPRNEVVCDKYGRPCSGESGLTYHKEQINCYKMGKYEDVIHSVCLHCGTPFTDSVSLRSHIEGKECGDFTREDTQNILTRMMNYFLERQEKETDTNRLGRQEEETDTNRRSDQGAEISEEGRIREAERNINRRPGRRTEDPKTKSTQKTTRDRWLEIRTLQWKMVKMQLQRSERERLELEERIRQIQTQGMSSDKQTKDQGELCQVHGQQIQRYREANRELENQITQLLADNGKSNQEVERQKLLLTSWEERFEQWSKEKKEFEEKVHALSTCVKSSDPIGVAITTRIDDVVSSWLQEHVAPDLEGFERRVRELVKDEVRKIVRVRMRQNNAEDLNGK